MLKKYKSMSISQIQKILLKRGFKISRLKKNSNFSNFKSIYLTSFLSFFLIGFFFILPISIDFMFKTFKQNKTFENYSKKYLEKVLSGENLVSDNNNDNILDERHLYEDIEIESGPSLSVRIEASVLNQVFEDDGYTLKQVRKNKLVKPFEVGMLPEELKQIESSKIRKDLFIKIVLPLVLSENNRILRDRTTLFKILNKNNNTKSEKNWLKKKI